MRSRRDEWLGALILLGLGVLTITGVLPALAVIQRWRFRRAFRLISRWACEGCCGRWPIETDRHGERLHVRPLARQYPSEYGLPTHERCAMPAFLQGHHGPAS